MKTYTKFLQVLAAGTLSLGALNWANAVPTLTIFDGISTITVVDQGVAPADVNPVPGAVTWIGTIGVWNLNVDTGFTKPAIGSATSPQMDLHFSGGSTAAGTLTLTFSEVGFTYVGGLIDQWGGTADGTVTNAVLKNGVSFINQGPLGPGAFSSTASGLVSLVAGDTLSLVVTINHTAGGQLTTGDKDVHPAPDNGLTVSLLGCAMVGLFAVRRRLNAVSRK